MRYTVTDIIKELEAELAIRRRAYPKWVASGKLTEDSARRKIELIEDAVKLLRGIADEQSQDEALDALLTQRVREADAQGRVRIVTSKEILDHTGIPPRRLGLMMQERGWQRVWVAHGVRGWLLPTPAESVNTNANIVDNSNANTVAAQSINSNENTVDNSSADTVALQECDHRLMALADLTQMDDLSYVALARQMLQRVKDLRLCGRCALVAGAIQTSQLDTASRARQRIAEALSRAGRQPAPPVAAEIDPMLLIDEEYRALAQLVMELLAAHRSETFMRLCDALEKRVGRGKANQTVYMLARLAEQPGFQHLVKIERKDGDHLLKSVWTLRSEPSLFSA